MALRRIILSTLVLMASILAFNPTQAQEDNTSQVIDRFLLQYASENGLTPLDVSGWEITSQSTSTLSGATYIYIRQKHQGVPVYNGVANFTLVDGSIRHHGLRLQAHLAERANAATPVLTPEEAIQAAARHLKLETPTRIQQLSHKGRNTYRYQAGEISAEEIPVDLVYMPLAEGELTLSWDLAIALKDGSHWWSLRVDAKTGTVVDQVDWVTHCTFVDHPFEAHGHTQHNDWVTSEASTTTLGNGTYNVFPISVESPNHGARVLLVDPGDSLASPFGWHDIDGVSGAEYTITRGNNVYASDDANADNVPGYSPDGGPSLVFDFPIDLNQPAASYLDASVTNLFYYNNMMHDVWYQYGFDEVSGNFQANNYGRGGQGDDYVNADGQDGAGLNNANFGTPPDGSNPRMQMFLWQSGSGSAANMVVDTPFSIAGAYTAIEAGFGPGLPSTPLTGDLVIANDGTGADPNDICETIINGPSLTGKIAVINRGSCNFVNKVFAAEQEGAIAVVMVNDAPGAPITMGGVDPGISIPSVMISQADGNTIKTALASGGVQVTLNGGIPPAQRDGSFDNGIIAHEYTHGISNRLTGGPTNAGCLSNAEQMGEGWSDWYGLMMDFNPAFRDRGIGTFASDQATTGVGIRNARYSYDMNINPYTYGDVANTGLLSQPHGIGFVWCTMLWDLTLVMVDTFGYDPDLLNGSGGNNMMMALVTEAMKIQPCQPGFVDGRDAILAADSVLFAGAHTCMIWDVFARRGLGYSADQGSSDSRTDQVEAFDIPTTCQTPTAAPVSGFALGENRGCGNVIRFEDQSSEVPQSWFWDFGDGNTSTLQNPTHTFVSSGNYLITQIVTNTLGADTTYFVITVSLPAGPVVDGAVLCAGDSAFLVPQDSGQFIWYDGSGVLIDTLAFIQTPGLISDTLFSVEKIIEAPIENIGPADAASVGGGGYHGTTFTGTVNFEAETGFTIKSVWIDAGSPGTRTVNLWDDENAAGNLIQQVTVNVPAAGPQRITLDMEVPSAGSYSLGATNEDLYRNNGGASYPYTLANVATMTGSSAGPDFYYYFYDWEVQAAPCISDRVEANVLVKTAAFGSTQDSATATFDFLDLSTGASAWAWNFGDGVTSTLQNPSHTYAVPDTYTVSLMIDGLCAFQDTVVAVRTTGIATLESGLEVYLQPNPAKDHVSLTFGHLLSDQAQVEILTTKGQVLRTEMLEPGIDQQTLEISNLAEGVYLVRVTHLGIRQVLKLVVSP